MSVELDGHSAFYIPRRRDGLLIQLRKNDEDDVHPAGTSTVSEMM